MSGLSLGNFYAAGEERPDPMAGMRAACVARDARLREKSSHACRLCRGRGKTTGWVAQGYTSYACPCTGEAAWQEPIR